MTAATSDDQLVRFCESRYPRLVGMLSLYCRDRFVAEELAQESLARACRDWAKVQSMEDADAWVRRVALNLAKSRFRQWVAERRAQDRLTAASATAHEDGDTATSVSVRDAVSMLPHRQKAVVVLRHYVGLTFPEIGHTLGLPEGTVKSLNHRAMRSLRTRLRESEEREATHAR